MCRDANRFRFRGFRSNNLPHKEVSFVLLLLPTMKPTTANRITVVLMALMAMMVPEIIAFVPPTALLSRSSPSSSMMIPSKKPSLFFANPNPAATPSLPNNNEDENSLDENKRTTLQPDPVLFKYMKPVALATAAGLAILASTLAMTPLPADAAMSGGRMGGSFSAPSRSRSYGGGGGGGGYSRSYSSGGYSGGYRGRSSTTIIAPMPFYSPFYVPPPPVIYGGGVGAIPTVSRGISPFSLLFLGGFGFLFISSFFNNVRPTMETSWSEVIDNTSGTSALGSGTSVLSLSVAVEVPNRDDPSSLLSVLTRLSQTANTGDRKGVQNLTSQVALEVLRRKSSIQSASSDYQHFRDATKAERQFNKWSVEQRSKFEQENANVFSGVDRSVKVKRLPGNKVDANATMAVITLVMAIQGDSTKIPKISNLKCVEEALRKISSDAKVGDCLVSAEILWTPEDRSETLTRQEVIADYPELIDV
jgi:uncharacterized membrane protein